MVPVDFPKIKSWPVIEFGMEIFIADQYVQFVTGNGDGDYGMAFLKPPVPPWGNLDR